jgi:cellulose synthase/poly-beta-1,6-N-acetylglucosamine synthase-like glycosyltransferase
VADGAIFAMRKDFYHDLEDQDINDFVIPLNVVGQNMRVVMDPEVYCLEEPSEGMGREYARQVRITNRTLGAIRRNTRFLNPFKYGSFAFFLLSHKVLRFMVPFFAVGIFLTSFLLISFSVFYLMIFAGLCLFILAGMAGLLGLARSRIIDLCSAFLMTNVAYIVGWARFITGRADTLWTPRR